MMESRFKEISMNATDRGLDRRQWLRTVVAGAGAAGAAAVLPGTGAAGVAAAIPPGSALNEVGRASQTPAGQSAAGPALGVAEPPDPSLTAAVWKPKFLDDHQAATVLAVADMMIPETETPGARAAHADRFIDLLLATDAPGTGEESGGGDLVELLFHRGTGEARTRYVGALNWLDGYCIERYAVPFVGLDGAQQEAVLGLLTHPGETAELNAGRGAFALIKNSIVTAYYSSEIGARQELKYETNPFHTGVPMDCDQPGKA